MLKENFYKLPGSYSICNLTRLLCPKMSFSILVPYNMISKAISENLCTCAAVPRNQEAVP